MDLRSGQAFWPIKNGLLGVYPPLSQDQRCEVVVIGGGITGALVAYYLLEAGVDTLVVDKRDIAGGSTSASTALLQYEIDVHLSDLIGLIGREAAVRAYSLCYQAIDKLEALTSELGEDSGFMRRNSLYLASRPKHLKALEAEHQARQQAGIATELWSPGQIAERYGFTRPAALFSTQAAQVDAYRLTHQLLRHAQARGLRVYDRTEVTAWQPEGEGVCLHTDRGYQIRARRMVFATGYEALHYLRRPIALLRNTYALVSEPLRPGEGWYRQSLIWETARPYLYLRTTQDHRVMMGGEDESFRTLPIRERRIPAKQRRLEKRFAELFPHIALETAYAWAGTFGETKDGLAYIGETEEIPGAYFALGFGGNGTTYSIIAAEIVRDLFLGKDNPDRHIFRFDR